MSEELNPMSLPTKYEGSARIILLETPQKDKVLYRDEVDRIVAQIPLSRDDAADLGFEQQWKAANKAGKRFCWRIVLLQSEDNGR